jgi:ketosteroid isomerase-like protein
MSSKKSEADPFAWRTRRRFLSGMLRMVLLPDAIVCMSTEESLGWTTLQETKRKMSMTLAREQISDRVEIEDVLARYCYAVDDRDWDAYRILFTEDAVLDDRVTGGIRSGVEDHVQYLKKALAKVQLSQHAISTVLIDVHGNHAKVRAHCSCPMVVDLGEAKTHVFFQGLWYRNSLVRTPEGWKISHLVEEGYWTYNMPPHFAF